MKQFHEIKDAIEDIKNGKMVIVVDDENRENEGDLVISAEMATPEIINFMACQAKGLICVPIKKSLAQKLNFFPMVEKNEDNHGTAFTVSVDEVTTDTGISAFERAKTIQKIVDDTATSGDFRRPGHIFP